jgi:hypothetical protein
MAELQNLSLALCHTIDLSGLSNTTWLVGDVESHACIASDSIPSSRSKVRERGRERDNAPTQTRTAPLYKSKKKINPFDIYTFNILFFFSPISVQCKKYIVRL